MRNNGFLKGLLLVAVVVCALSVVTSQHKARKLFNELQNEREHADQMEVEWGQLQLEQSTLATSARIEKIAVRQLQMQIPKSGYVRMIQIGQLEQPLQQSSSAIDRGNDQPFAVSDREEKIFEGAKQQP